jgi:hypothetical protein
MNKTLSAASLALAFGAAMGIAAAPAIPPPRMAVP